MDAEKNKVVGHCDPLRMQTMSRCCRAWSSRPLTHINVTTVTMLCGRLVRTSLVHEPEKMNSPGQHATLYRVQNQKVDHVPEPVGRSNEDLVTH